MKTAILTPKQIWKQYKTCQTLRDLKKVYQGDYRAYIKNYTFKPPCISEGNSKLGDISNFSLPPVISCANCAKCYRACYVQKSFLSYINVRTSQYNNLYLVKNNLPIVDNALRAYFDKQNKNPLQSDNVQLFRIHVSGDFISQTYIDMWENLARDYKNVLFLAFTKAFKFDYNHNIKNLKYVFSLFPGMKTNKLNPKISRAYAGNMGLYTKRKNERIIDCIGNCEACGVCWNLDNDISVNFKMH